jgi:hypothetical protein
VSALGGGSGRRFGDLDLRDVDGDILTAGPSHGLFETGDPFLADGKFAAGSFLARGSFVHGFLPFRYCFTYRSVYQS